MWTLIIPALSVQFSYCLWLLPTLGWLDRPFGVVNLSLFWCHWKEILFVCLVGLLGWFLWWVDFIKCSWQALLIFDIWKDWMFLFLPRMLLCSLCYKLSLVIIYFIHVYNTCLYSLSLTLINTCMRSQCSVL